MSKKSKNPSNDGKKIERNPDGTLKKGSVLNPVGKVAGTRHLSTMLDTAIRKLAEGKEETYDTLLVKRVLQKAIGDGDMKAIEHVWDRLEGKAPQAIDITSGGESLSRIDPTDPKVIDALKILDDKSL